MKHLISIIITIAAFISFVEAAPPTTVEGLIEALRKAIIEKDQPALDSLTYSVGMSDSDKQMAARAQQGLMSGREIDEINTTALPEDFQSIMVARGKKIEPTNPPKGLIQIKYKEQEGSSFSSSLPYTEVEGRYYLIGTKTTELDWDGPPDKQIGFGVMGVGQDSIKVRVKWNASGIQQEQIFSAPSAILIGQYIESVVVTSDRDDADVTLTIREGGDVIYTSEALKGKGNIEYERK